MNTMNTMNTMKGILFGSLQVTLDPKTPSVGGSFTPRKVKNDVAYAYDPRLIKVAYDHLSEIDNPVLVDVGASTGSFSLLTVSIPSLVVFAFEPNLKIVQLLRHNLELNAVSDRVVVFQIALTARNETRTLSIPQKKDMSGHATLGTTPTFGKFTQTHVNAVSLDLALQGKVDKIDLLKVDTEGCELEVFQGAHETLTRFHPPIIYENNAAAAAQFGRRLAQTEELLRSYGYTTFKSVGAEDVWAT